MDSINKIVENMTADGVCDEMVSVIEDLFHDDWFTPRVSSASLISKVRSLELSDVGVSKDRFLDRNT